MFRILIEQSGQIKETKVKIEKFLKEREQTTQLAIVPLTSVPIISTSVTGASNLATITVEGWSKDSSEEIIKAIDDLSIRGQEIEKLKTQLKNFQEQKLKVESVYLTKLHKTNRLTHQFEQLKSESTMAQTLQQAKEILWIEINEAMIETWPSIQIIFQKEELIQRSKEVIEEVKVDLGQKLGEATTLVRLLNSKTSPSRMTEESWNRFIY